MQKLILNNWINKFNNAGEIVFNSQNFILWKGHGPDTLSISWLQIYDCHLISLSEEMLTKFEQDYGQNISLDNFIKFTTAIHFDWNPADHIFYLDKTNLKLMRPTDSTISIKKLSLVDEAKFNEMVSECSPEDLDAGFVELDQELVYGLFKNDKLVAMASAYALFDSSDIMDIGYITHPAFRGLGFGALCAFELIKEIFKQNKIPQIRVQSQLISSVKIATKLGFIERGKWQYDAQ